MIDWDDKIKHLRRMSDELEQQALNSKGRERLIIGRIADELRAFSSDIARELALEEGYEFEETIYPTDTPLPDWVDQPLPVDDDASEDADAEEALPDWMDQPTTADGTEEDEDWGDDEASID
jgi:hypothetical protein